MDRRHSEACCECRTDKRWIASVAMISEGVDIKRFRVLMYLPNALTELAFRQAIGRVVRSIGPTDDTRASEFVYGAFRTYQVPLFLIANHARLDLNHLLSHDPLTARREREGIDNTSRSLFVAINGASDLVI
jgi:hypothetical protein